MVFLLLYGQPMPNKAAAAKALRQTKKHTVKNQRMKMHVKALIHQVQALAKEGKRDEALQTGRKLQQAIAKAARASVFHKNKAANKISALHKMLSKTVKQ
ncbi:30S ribosomal protein S20 [Candidatus Uhrbacteria bacterium]|nr:30S ribosomal protein S20 [Candidatus Uhrbacteria bacterium]